jgi:hypothetical protein
MSTMSKKAAIRHARRTVSTLHPCGGGWTFYQLDTDRRAWRETNPRPYYDAAAARRAALITAARAALDLPEIDPATMDSGRWTDALS